MILLLEKGEKKTTLGETASKKSTEGKIKEVEEKVKYQEISGNVGGTGWKESKQDIAQVENETCIFFF